MHPADAVILVIILISVGFGVFRGFAREAFSLAGWIAAYMVARVFHGALESLLVDYIATPSLRMAAAWGGLFVTTLLLAAIAGYMVMSLMDAAGVRGIDRFFGAIFGLARGLILVLALVVIAAPFASRDHWWQSAKLPREFMRYELVGRELKSRLMKVASAAGNEEPVSQAASGTTDRQP